MANNNAYYAYNYLRDKYGYTPVQAQGIVGNLMAESSMNTGARNRGDGRDGSDSVGIAQWNGDRARGLHSFAKERGQSWDNMDTQLDYVHHELNNSERRAGDLIRNATDVHGATAGMISYERPQGWSANNPTAGHNWRGRLQNAMTIGGATPEQLAQAVAATPGTVGGGNPDAYTGSATGQQGVVAGSGSQGNAVAGANPEKKGPLIPFLAEAPKILGGALGITGSGTKEDPTMWGGVQMSGDKGLTSSLAGMAQAFGAGQQQEQAAPVAKTQNNPIQVSFDIAASSKSQDDDLRKRRGGLAGFGGFTSRRV